MSDTEDSDDWATDELPEFPNSNSNTQQPADHKPPQADDEGWARKLPPPVAVVMESIAAIPDDQSVNQGEPMIIVDMTALTEGDHSLPEIHSKFDANSVNDPAAVKKLRMAIEEKYEKYAKNADLIAVRTVIPCGSTVWRPALASLRLERPGHYFCPIFPTKNEVLFATQTF